MTKIVIILSLFWTVESVGQLSIKVVFEQKSDSLFFVKNLLDFPSQIADSLALLTILRGGVANLHKQAYLEASFDFISKKDSFIYVGFHLGKRYDWATIRKGNVPLAFLAQVGFREKLFDNKPLLFSDIRAIEEGLLTYAENNGYPFAQIGLDSLHFDNGRVSAALMMYSGDVFKMDSINIEGNVKVSAAYMHHYLGLKKGSVFNRSKVLQVSSRLQELPFLSERIAPTVIFKEDRTVQLNLLLDNKKASKWDFLVGVQPNTTPSGTQKFAITFNGNVDFQNLLGLGEHIFANFENLRPQSPRLNLKLTYPYILNLPIGFDGAFDLYKRDSSYIETRINAGGLFLMSGNNYLKLFWDRYRSSNLLINISEIISTKKLPTTLDIATQTLGVEWLKQDLDYRFNPRRGWSALLRGSAGWRQTLKNNDILNLRDLSDTTFNFLTLYDSLSLNSFQYSLGTKLAFYIPIFKRSVVKVGVQSGFILTSTPISFNEQYRIGGNRLLRGFDEESIFATQYAISTLEYRLLIGRNSYLYAFTDWGYVNDRTRTTRRKDMPLGFGAGITFETKVGLFGFTLAAGRQQNNPIDLRNTKTHFGYISLF